MAGKTAFLFPGQGSQSIGMGQDLQNSFAKVKEIFQQVDDICRKPISRLCFEGPMSDLTLTENLQPAITAVSLACLTALTDSGVSASAAAGHSLGEYAALVSAGVVSNEDALRMVHKRGALMHREALAHPGAMAAVIGMDWAGVEEVIKEAADEGILSIANHNTAEQIVITGEQEPIDRAVNLVKERGKKAIPLKVSGAWHSKLMEGAVNEFRDFLEAIPFNEPRSEVLFNATAKNETDTRAMKDIMANQLISPVKWYDSMQAMLLAGVEVFVEVGPKNVLSGLLKKILPRDTQVRVANVEDTSSLNRLLREM
jgi:[acyl-carrier-protein] S-malonyltransferase